ncbi:MAG: paraquat-inducible protein A [Oceanicaulis sp.]
MALTDPRPSPPEPGSGAATGARPAGGGLARALTVVAALFLLLGLWLPIMETRQLWVFKTEYSLFDAVQALWQENEAALAGLVFLFSFVTPTAKLAALSVLLTRRAGSQRGPLSRFVAAVGRWSLADVLVVAVLIVVWSNAGALGAASLPGLWFFGGSALVLLLAAELALRDLR